MKKRLVMLLALCLIVSVLSSCGPAAPKNVVYGTFDYYIGNISTLNPHTSPETDGGFLIDLCLLGLYRHMPNAAGDGFEIAPQLAESDPISKNSEGTLWEIKLRKNAVWENGDKITADDFIYSIQMALDPVLLNSRGATVANDRITIKNASKYYLQKSGNTAVSWDEVGLKKIDDYTLQLEVEGYVTPADVKTHFTSKYTALVHKPTYEAGMNSDRTANTYGTLTGGFMSCGPFILTSRSDGSQYVFTRNENYVLPETIHLEKIVCNVITDANTALEMFLAGQLDTVALGAAAKEQYADDPRIWRAPADTVGTAVINIGNTKNNSILANVNFRKALYYATDRAGIAKIVQGEPAHWIVASGVLSDMESSVPFREVSKDYLAPNFGYDPALAKQYFETAMQEVGVDHVDFSLNYVQTSANNKATAEFLLETWPAALGDKFNFKIEGVSSAMSSTIRKSWSAENPNTYESALTGGWAVSQVDVANGFKVYLSSYGNKNEPFYSEEFDTLWEEGNQSIQGKTDKAYRLAKSQDMEKYLLDNMITIPLYEVSTFRLINPQVKLPLGGYVSGFGWGFQYSTITPETK